MKLTVIGAGNMGGAIALGAIKKGIVDSVDVTVADPSSKFAEKLKKDNININYTTDNIGAVNGADLVIVAVKPWLMEEVIRSISDVIDRKSQVVVSIAAGISFDQLGEWLGTERLGGIGIYRVIPNTAISIGKSTTFISSFETTSEQDSKVMDLFKALGNVFEIGESQIRGVTALSSSGIAYAYKYIDAAVKGGEQLGLSREEALGIVIDTVKGAVAMLEANGSQPQTEIDKVTTPGGITLKGLAAMEEGGFTQAVINGLLATK